MSEALGTFGIIVSVAIVAGSCVLLLKSCGEQQTVRNAQNMDLRAKCIAAGGSIIPDTRTWDFSCVHGAASAPKS